MAPDRIRPRTLKGFRDFLPDVAAAREWIVDTAKSVYRSFGFLPIDTPALEYSEILLGKGGSESDKQMYRFEDQGGRDVAMRFDLTVPLARFVAEHAGTLGLPFKRYHVGPVWRGENTQRGRYREFLQFDFDTIGTTSPASDIETVLVVVELVRALGLTDATVRFNHRGVLNGVLERLELTAHAPAVLRSLDKLPKIGAERVAEEIAAATGASRSQIDQILALGRVTGSTAEVLDRIGELAGDSVSGAAGVERLAAVAAGLEASGVGEHEFAIDVSIARGLDYYTGLVYETFLASTPGIGSISSGGRYDDLAAVYTKQELPGIGGSLGVDRLLDAFEELDRIGEAPASATVLLTLFDENRLEDHLAVAARLRHSGISVEVYPDARKLGAQLRYADRRGHRFAVIIGDGEWDAGTAQLKALRTGESSEVPLEELADRIRDARAPAGRSGVEG